MIQFECAAILFDLDGVLVDSTRSVERQWRIWAREMGIEGDKVTTVAHGVRAVEVIRTVAPHLDAEAEVRKLESREAEDLDGVSAMPGAIELVRAVPEGRWGVVTSGTRHLATKRLRLFGIPIPKVMVTADDVAKGKPDPAPYLRGAELLGVHPSVTEIIGELSMTDIERIVERRFRYIQPRWEDRPAIWQRLIQAACSPDIRLARDFTLRGLQLLAGELL